jgi:molybdenum cofactor cytidylyltransferase
MRGNPVLFAREFFPEIQSIRGDVGARAIINAHPKHVHEVEFFDDAVIVDVDDLTALEALKSRV